MNKKGTVFIGDRNTGKSTRLFNIFEENVIKGKKILLIDSATDHAMKSIINKVSSKYKSDVIHIKSCTEDMIIFPEIVEDYYPQKLLNSKNRKIFLCDASLHLEKGYEYPAGELRDRQRMLYKKFCMQVIRAAIEIVDVIIIDEIELISESREVIEAAYENNVEIFMALHFEKGLAELKDLFQIKRLNEKF